MSTLFELTKDQAELKALVESGELTEEMAADTFEAMQMELDDKITAYCRVIQSFDNDLALIKAEIDRLTTLKGEKENQIKRVKKSLMLGLVNLEKNNFDTGLFKGHIRKGSVSVNILDPNKIPAEFIEVKVQEVPDKNAIKAALKDGAKIEGAELKQGESSLVIK